MMQGVEHDEAISIYALSMQVRRLFRRHCPSPLSPALTPRNDNSEVFQQSPAGCPGKRIEGNQSTLTNNYRMDDADPEESTSGLGLPMFGGSQAESKVGVNARSLAVWGAALRYTASTAIASNARPNIFSTFFFPSAPTSISGPTHDGQPDSQGHSLIKRPAAAKISGAIRNNFCA